MIQINGMFTKISVYYVNYVGGFKWHLRAMRNVEPIFVSITKGGISGTEGGY
jgi:hypothetical protein